MFQDPNASKESNQWLRDITKRGRWFDIGPEDLIPADISGDLRSILHMFQICFTPEIRRRINDGRIPADFVLISAQLIQPIVGENIIRLNSEVRGQAKVKLRREFQKSENVYSSDLSKFEAFDVALSDLDCGHFTLLWHNAGWAAFFDFRSGRETCAKLLTYAEEFLKSAKNSASLGYIRPSIDNMFSCCELISKAHLTLAFSKTIKSKTHASIHSQINKWTALGNVNQEFTAMFNRYSEIRNPAKYNVEVNLVAPSDIDFILAEQKIAELRARVRHQIDE